VSSHDINKGRCGESLETLTVEYAEAQILYLFNKREQPARFRTISYYKQATLKSNFLCQIPPRCEETFYYSRFMKNILFVLEKAKKDMLLLGLTYYNRRAIFPDDRKYFVLS